MISTHQALKTKDFSEAFQIPATFPAENAVPEMEIPPEISPLWIAGPEYQGRTTRFFAWLGIPEKIEKPVPGIVLVHGGGGTAFLYWVKHCLRQGYAVIAMDTVGAVPLLEFEEGECRKYHDFMPGPTDKDIFKPGCSIRDSWPFHAVSTVISAHSFLRSLPEVDPERIGITGISWGGFLTCIANGVDSRFAVSAPVYGCGYLKNLSRWSNPTADPIPELDSFLEIWDPKHYLPQIKNPVLFVSDPTDPAYYQPAWMQSTLLPAGQVYRASLPGIGHSHTDGMQPVIDRFFEVRLRNRTQNFPELQAGYLKDRLFHCSWQKDQAVKASLIYTADVGTAPDRNWQTRELPLPEHDTKLETPLPENTRSAFINVTFRSQVTLSTPDFAILQAGNRDTA